jgi:heat shock protein HslJ
MKYSCLFLLGFMALNCSPRLSPDAGWGNQRWVLTEMKGVPVQQSGGRRDAFIRFDVIEKRFSGNGGCNQVNGTYTIDKSEIRFTDVIATKMSCADIAFENTFLSTLNTVDRYEMEGNNLRLKDRRETVLILSPAQLNNY